MLHRSLSIAWLASIAAAQSAVQIEMRSAAVLSQRVPVAGPGLATPVGSAGSPKSASWTQMSAPGGLYLQGIDMATPQVGFAVAELGVVLRTQDGGHTWQTIQNLGFPYYWYGVDALDANTVVAAGFQNQTGDGIIEWSTDGGNTWQPVVSLSGPGSIRWLWRVQFIDGNQALAEAAWAGGVHRTQTGGRLAADWSYSQVSPNWLQGSFTFLPDRRAWISGYDQIYSPDAGATWSVSNGTSAIFDGPIAVRPSGVGVSGGGSISPTVAGWIYRTTNGAQSWSPNPTATLPYPARALLAYDDSRFYCGGGNLYSGAGGVWLSLDGGATWNLDQNIGNEVRDLCAVRIDAGQVNLFAASYGGIWRTTLSDPISSPIASYCFCASGAPCGNTSATSGCINGSGQGALLSASGTASVALDDLALTASQMPPNVFGIVFMGPNAAQMPFGNGLLCIGASGLKRFPVHSSGATGSFSQGPGLAAFTHAHFGFASWISAGQTWRFQAWFRDSQGPCGASSNFSNGISVTYLP